MFIIVENKKIKNADPNSYNNIQFRSKSEVMVYKTLVENGIIPLYEQETIHLWEGYKPTIPFYKPKNKELIIDCKKLADIKYTPDFSFTYNDIKVYIEVKGFANDVYPYKCKLFRQYLEDNYPNKNCLFFEIHTKKDILKAIQIIKDYDSSRKNGQSSGNTTIQ